MLISLNHNFFSKFEILYKKYFGHNNKNKLTSTEMAELDELNKKFKNAFDKLNGKGENIWVTPAQFSRITGATETQISKVVNSTSGFVRSSKGLLTTRKLYEKNTPTWKKIIHSLRHKI